MSQDEADFLAAFIDEYTAVELGLATRRLQERGIFGVDLLHLLDPYSRGHPPSLKRGK